jgi:hypothetical protein
MNRLRHIVLASLLLVAAPTFAQTGPDDDTRAPAAGQPSAVPWSSLTDDQRKVRQQSLSRGSQRWLNMSPNERKDARGRFKQWSDLPADRRKDVRNRWQQFRTLPPTEQQAVRENFRRFKNMPPERRKALRERWQNASPAERDRMLDRSRQQRERNTNRRSRRN